MGHKGKAVAAEFTLTFRSPAEPGESNDKPHSVKEPGRIVMAQKRTFAHLPDVCWLNYWFVLDILFAFTSVDLGFALEHFVGCLETGIVC